MGLCLFVAKSFCKKFSFLGLRFVNTVSFHPDGNCIAVGTTDNVVKVTGYCSARVVLVILTFVSATT